MATRIAKNIIEISTSGLTDEQAQAYVIYLTMRKHVISVNRRGKHPNVTVNASFMKALPIDEEETPWMTMYRTLREPQNGGKW